MIILLPSQPDQSITFLWGPHKEILSLRREGSSSKNDVKKVWGFFFQLRMVCVKHLTLQSSDKSTQSLQVIKVIPHKAFVQDLWNTFSRATGWRKWLKTWCEVKKINSKQTQVWREAIQPPLLMLLQKQKNRVEGEHLDQWPGKIFYASSWKSQEAALSLCRFVFQWMTK